MKKFENLFMIAVVALFSLTMFSCGDDDDDNDESAGNVDNLIGTWSIIKDEGYEKYNGESDPWDNTFPEGEVIVVVSADHKISGGDFDEGSTWSYKGNKLTLNLPYKDEIEIQVWTVLELTSTRLVVECYEKEGENEYYQKTTFKKK